MDCTKMGAYKSAKDTPKCPKLYLPKLANCLPKLKVWDLDEKRLNWVSIVHALELGKALSLHLALSSYFKYDCKPGPTLTRLLSWLHKKIIVQR